MSAHPELTLFYSPRACSLSCHIALEKSELPFTAHEVKIRAGEHRRTITVGLMPGERFQRFALEIKC